MNTPKTPDNPPAFPRPGYHFVSPMVSGQDGMTLRDYFAAKAMPWCISKHWDEYPGPMSADCARQSAVAAYEIADSMLAEREKRTEAK